MASLPTNEVFPSSTVFQVVFQIKFPNLFYLESRVGDFQVAVMSQFPDSQLRLQKFVFASQMADEKLAAPDPDAVKIWTFSNRKGVMIELQTNSLTIQSTQHKSYNTGNDTFRPIIDFVLGAFKKQAPIPLVSRIGLRYINMCPVEEFTAEYLDRYYNLTLPYKRFSPASMLAECISRTNVKRDSRQLNYMETLYPPLEESISQARLMLDFDATSENVEVDRIMTETDALHSIIRSEFENSIKEPFIDLIRRPRSATQ